VHRIARLCMRQAETQQLGRRQAGADAAEADAGGSVAAQRLPWIVRRRQPVAHGAAPTAGN